MSEPFIPGPSDFNQTIGSLLPVLQHKMGEVKSGVEAYINHKFGAGHVKNTYNDFLSHCSQFRLASQVMNMHTIFAHSDPQRPINLAKEAIDIHCGHLSQSPNFTFFLDASFDVTQINLATLRVYFNQ